MSVCVCEYVNEWMKENILMSTWGLNYFIVCVGGWVYMLLGGSFVNQGTTQREARQEQEYSGRNDILFLPVED